MPEKYIKIYHKRNVQLVFICASIIFLPLFITSLLYDVVPGDIWIALVPFYLAPMCVAVDSKARASISHTIPRSQCRASRNDALSFRRLVDLGWKLCFLQATHQSNPFRSSFWTGRFVKPSYHSNDG